MNDREKLIDLIIDAKRRDPETGSFTEFLADHLIANGVTVSTDNNDGCKVGEIVFVNTDTLPYNYLHPLDGCKSYAKCEVVSIVKTKQRTYLKLKALYPSRMGKRNYLRYGICALGRTVFVGEPSKGE